MLEIVGLLIAVTLLYASLVIGHRTRKNPANPHWKRVRGGK